MTVSELIKELQGLLETYGDWPVVFRNEDFDPDLDIMIVYPDTDGEEETGEGRIVLCDDMFF